MTVGDIVRCNNSRRWGDSLSLVLEVWCDETGISRGAALLLNWTGTMWVGLDELEVVNAG
jgi:hypothetical protein